MRPEAAVIVNIVQVSFFVQFNSATRAFPVVVASIHGKTVFHSCIIF